MPIATPPPLCLANRNAVLARPRPVALVVVLALFAASCDRNSESAAPAVKLVIAEKARPASLKDARIYPAVVKPRIEAVQSFRVGGRIAARIVDVGDRVAAGQVLATLDATDWTLNLEGLRGQLAAATAQRDNVRADLVRFRELAAQKLMSSAEVDRQQHAVAAAEGQVAALTAQVQEAANKLGYTALKSDADGVVTKVIAEPGQVVGEGNPILIVAHSANLEVEFDVPEQIRGEIEKARSVKVSLWSQTDTTIDARIREIASEANSLTRAFRVRATLLQPPASAKLGMTANVRIDLGGPAGVSVPIGAVFDHDGWHAVWGIDQQAGTLRMVPVIVGEVEGNRYILTAGVQPGDLIVTAGVHRLTASDRVALYTGGEQTTQLGAER